MPERFAEFSTTFLEKLARKLSNELNSMNESDLFNTHSLETGRQRGTWKPEIGPETRDFLRYVVPEASRDQVRDAAVSILRRGISPQDRAGQETGLVVGYVQSGKTMSFEAVTVLARDNGFQMVIIIAGTSNPLLNQSTIRLRRDFRLDDAKRKRRWIQIKNPDCNSPRIQELRDVFQGWRDKNMPNDYKMTVLVTVLKNHHRLGNLIELVQSVGMEGVPVLVIDDEADQASLNTEVRQEQESTTYRRLMALRAALPLHTYLQYTATPQAPLLINILDTLSPSFVEVLTPGEEYVGGHELFDVNRNLVHIIPPRDVPTKTNWLQQPPDSLLKALRIFMVGVTAGLELEGNIGNRSMLVHPSHRTAQHLEYYNWVRTIFDNWKEILDLPDCEVDKKDLIKEFLTAYDELAQTVKTRLPPFSTLVPQFRTAFWLTRLLEVNARSGKTPKVDWQSTYGWILVGGQAMDRGFTIEGLTVTYMPRGIGVGNADTVQQRARFFGYKRSYLGFCRVFLEQGTHRAFDLYVDHEKVMRRQLISIRDSSRSLKTWKRAFVLDRELSPCRKQVLEFDYMRGKYSDGWVAPSVILAANDVLNANIQVVEDFVSMTNFEADVGHRDRTATQRHEVARDLSLRDVMERLIIPTRITGSRDSERITGLLVQLSQALETNSQESCTVFKMSPSTGRKRRVNAKGEVANLFQGEAPVHPRIHRGKIYPGDRKIRADSTVTVQIHVLTVTRNGTKEAENVPVLAIWIPARLAVNWIVQNQPTQAS